MKTEAKTFDPHSVDCDEFFELRATRLDVGAALGPDDLRHLQRLETVGALYALGSSRSVALAPIGRARTSATQAPSTPLLTSCSTA